MSTKFIVPRFPWFIYQYFLYFFCLIVKDTLILIILYAKKSKNLIITIVNFSKIVIKFVFELVNPFILKIQLFN